MSDTRNPLIGETPADTVSHCQQVLSIVQRANDYIDMYPDEDDVMGYHLIHQTVRQALKYERDRDCAEEVLEDVSDAARIAFARFESAAEQLTADECVEELQGRLFSVGLAKKPELCSDLQGNYTVSKVWTLTGLRYALAKERFFESITCDVEEEDE